MARMVHFVLNIFNNNFSVDHSEKTEQKSKTFGLARCVVCRALDPGTS